MDYIKHPAVGDLETLKDIMPIGTYGMSGTGNDSFSIETHLDGKKAYVCDYKQRQ